MQSALEKSRQAGAASLKAQSIARQKKSEKTKRKRIESKDHLHAIRERACYASKIIVAIDMSEASPGLAVFDCRSDPIRVGLLGFARLKSHLLTRFCKTSKEWKGLPKHRVTTREGYTLDVTLAIIPRLIDLKSKEEDEENQKEGDDEEEDEEEEDQKVGFAKLEEIESLTSRRIMQTIQRNEYQTEILMDFLAHCIGTPTPDILKQTMVVMENYAFDAIKSAAGTSSLTGLAQVAGTMQNKLFRQGFQVDLVPPTTIKLWFQGKGSGDKFDMWKEWREITQDKLPLHNWLKGSFATKVPSPHQDLVDAFALGYFLVHVAQIQNPNCGTIKKLKPKDMVVKRKRQKRA